MNASISGPMMLLLDTEQPKARGDLNSWLGEQNAAALWPQRRRFITILSLDTGGDPRYAHAIECTHDLATLFAALECQLDMVESEGSAWGIQPMHPASSLCLIDMRFRLEPADYDWINRKLDARVEPLLRRASAQGTA